MGIRSFLNEKSDYLINWNRPGSLFFGSHRYSYQELLERGFVIASTAALGFLAWNQSSDGGMMPFAYGAALGFLMSHTITMSPLIYKRLEAKWACDALQDKIDLKLIAKNTDFRALVDKVVAEVLNENSSKSPSAVWGRRKRLLTTLLDWLDEPQLSLKTLTDTLKSVDVIDHLDKNDIHGSSAKAALEFNYS
jgi:hypothetical protein